MAGESNLKGEARKFAISRGWFYDHIIKTSRNSFPDSIFIRKGVIIFVEFKDKGEKPTAKQLKRHKDMRDCGATVFVVDKIEQAYDIFK